jgi:hypothetical protein
MGIACFGQLILSAGRAARNASAALSLDEFKGRETLRESGDARALNVEVAVSTGQSPRQIVRMARLFDEQSQQREDERIVQYGARHAA